MSTGLIHLYCGDGKGKTTAAMGLSLRAAGRGLRVVIVQFLKSGDSGELNILRTLPNITVLSGKGSTKFSFQMSEKEKLAAKALHETHLREALGLPFDLLVLDEAAAAHGAGLLDTALLEEALFHRPPDTELVLTGRNPAAFLVEAADYVTEMTCRKHPFERCIAAREGIEF